MDVNGLEQVECPQCGQLAEQQTFDSTEQIDCYTCGYHRRLELDQSHNPPQHKIKQLHGLGAYRLEYSDGIIERGCFTTDQSIDYFKQQVVELEAKDLRLVHASYTVLINNQVTQTILINKTPAAYSNVIS